MPHSSPVKLTSDLTADTQQTPPRLTDAPNAPRSRHRRLPVFVAGVGSWFTAFGMQGVLFSWLVVGVLQANADWVGIAQSALMLPSILLVLLGGVVADRSDRRSLLLALHLLAAGLSGCLVLIVAQGWLSMSLLIGYALCMGTVQAFAMPARDACCQRLPARTCSGRWPG